MSRAIQILATSAALLIAPAAFAHPVTVDGNATEWFTRAPNSQNLGLVARNATQQGELVWLDAVGDARTDLSAPEVQGDIVAFQITGNATGVGFLLRRTPGTSFTGQPVQVQIAVDVDRTAGNGQEFFAAFADTKVSNNARWEFLVQTLFGSGGTAQVIDTAFNKVADAQAVVGSGGDVEIYVPWSTFGLSAPPTSPLRFSVATFRAQNNDLTVDIPGANISNAVDAVTNYGDPRASAYPNTWIDLQDGTLDYWLDVWFATTGEVYAPLVVDRFASDAPGGSSDEWFVVKNMSPDSLPLGGGFHIGDEETPDGTEGMFTFPASAALAAGASFTVARLGSTYQTYFGKAPDAELPPSTSAGIADMLPYPAWTNGASSTSNSMQLANAGDELLVLDPQATILDIAAWGSVAYAGITSLTPVPGASAVAVRNNQDTDDCKVDFTLTGAQCLNDASCANACKSCVMNACANKAQGTACPDATVCNGAETCSNTGVCTPGQALDCNDNNVCTTDACSAATGCTHANAADGTSCSDGNACNGVETCTAGACTTSTPPICNDGNPCTLDQCDSIGGCQYPPATAGTACLDGNACNGSEACDGNGVCAAAAPLTCNDSNPCTTDTCDPTSGCTFQNSQAGAACADGNVCNGAETCDGAGVCAAGTALACDDNNPCTTDGCDTTTGCTHQNVSAGVACSDGNVCNGAETCNGAGACSPGTVPSCDDGNVCTMDECDPSTGCSHPSASAGSSCADADACNGAETCDGNGTCAAGTPPVCDDANDCTSDSCNSSSGCQHATVSDGTACVGVGCTGTCGAGTCQCSGGQGGSAGASGSGGEAGSAGSSGSGGEAGSAGSSGSGGEAGSGGTAGAGGEAGSGGTAGAGGAAGTSGAAGSGGTGKGGAAGSSGAAGSAGATGAGGAAGNTDAGLGGASAGPAAASGDEGGCGCRTTGRSDGATAAWLLALAALVSLRRR
jgi:MYXO-CTERM domain-containing protein